MLYYLEHGIMGMISFNPYTYHVRYCDPNFTDEDEVQRCRVMEEANVKAGA